MTQQIAIIGAGIAGLAAARKLRAAGLACTLFDKSRGLGGRMATRRTGEWHFDHGAQYVTARGPRFRALIEEWRAAGQAAEWFDGAFVGLPGMSAPTRGLADGAVLVGGCAGTGLERDGAGWTVLTAQGPADTAANGRFAAVILALPAPQLLPLAASAHVAFAELAAVRYAPCWTLMLGFAAPLALRQDRLRPDDGVIAWIARNSAKPGRPPGKETVVVQATAAWSRDHLEAAPDAIAAVLLPRFLLASGLRVAPDHLAAHRWRYALVEQAAGRPCLWDAPSRLAACGDWCLGPRVEAAFDSGEAAADAVLAAG
jgi:renalase